MRSPRSAYAWLLAKEWRELWSARAWWLLLAAAGPLVGLSFINAVQMYAELSGLNGTTDGVGEAFSPLVGVWAPTFSAYELVAAFLFPFVVIRLVGGDRQSGALKLELQQPLSPLTRIGAKSMVLLAAWAIALAPALIGGLLWKSYGGSTYAPEIATVVMGHVLNACLTIALGAAAASLAEHPSTAAIITLSVTVGTWVISFIAALQGGRWEQAAAFTPPALVAQFQHGLIRLDVVIAALVLMAFGLAIAAIWMRLGVPTRRRSLESLAALTVAAVCIAGGAFARANWDASENRQNSFAETDEAALRRITGPLKIEAHFAMEDSRRGELETRTLSKLRRLLPNLTVQYVSQTSVGLYEANTEHYGEIIYTLGNKQDTSRIVTTEGVLETIYGLAGITPARENDEDVFRGHPLAVPPRHAAGVFYGIWPALVGAAAFALNRRNG